VDTNLASLQPANDAGVPQIGPLFRKVQQVYLGQFRRWFGITAPTSVVAAVIFGLAGQWVGRTLASIVPERFFYHRTELIEIALLGLGSFFAAWLLGSFALGAVATIVGNLRGEQDGPWVHDSHERARERFGTIFWIALLTYALLLIGFGCVWIVNAALTKIFGAASFARHATSIGLVEWVVVASLVSWFGMAVPLALRDNTGAWRSLQKSLELADGYQGFLLLLVLESVVGSYVAWYVTQYVVRLLPSMWFGSWYVWAELVAGALASAAVQPPLFIGLSLLAVPEGRTQASEADLRS